MEQSAVSSFVRTSVEAASEKQAFREVICVNNYFETEKSWIFLNKLIS